MFILDDIVLSPVKGFMWIVRELHNAAKREIESESERLTQQLGTLYMLLETGQLTEAEFDAREKELLERIDELRAQGRDPEADEDETEDDDDSDEETEDDDSDAQDELAEADEADPEPDTQVTDDRADRETE